jgi:hypothetical protein
MHLMTHLSTAFASTSLRAGTRCLPLSRFVAWLRELKKVSDLRMGRESNGTNPNYAHGVRFESQLIATDGPR